MSFFWKQQKLSAKVVFLNGDLCPLKLFAGAALKAVVIPSYDKAQLHTAKEHKVTPPRDARSFLSMANKWDGFLGPNPITDS